MGSLFHLYRAHHRIRCTDRVFALKYYSAQLLLNFSDNLKQLIKIAFEGKYHGKTKHIKYYLKVNIFPQKVAKPCICYNFKDLAVLIIILLFSNRIAKTQDSSDCVVICMIMSCFSVI